MKRSLMFRLVRWWCSFYTVILFFSVYKALDGPERVGAMKLVLGTLPFAAMLGGTFGIYTRQRWGVWLSAVTLGLLTAWLPFAYKLLVSAGGNPGPLLVLFAGLAAANLIAAMYLVRLGYYGYPGNEKPSVRS